MLPIKTPKILLPKTKYDYRKWAVIAVDQFTSDKEYWKKLDSFVGDEPSALRLVLPEVYLNEEHGFRLHEIHDTMKEYLEKDLFDEYEGLILTERTTSYGNKRIGLIVAVDLESYNLDQTQKTMLRATEQTVMSRLPVRAEIREDALIELPHTLVLFEDEGKSVIEGLYARKDTFPKLYDFELNMNGGRIAAYFVKDSAEVFEQLERVTAGKAFPFGVGDGNHSLAASSLYWNKLKQGLTLEERECHPARYALVELNNLFADELKFEPIHRVVFGLTSPDSFFKGLKEASKGSRKIEYLYNEESGSFSANDNAILAIGELEDYIMACVARGEAKVDYVHGREYSIAAAKEHGGMVIFMPSIEKDSFFATVEKLGVLPRKTFSMGEAEEKRYYIEARKIR